MKLIALILIPLILAACAGTEKPPMRDTVNCAQGFTFSTEFANDGSEVTLITKRGQRVVLPSQPAATGMLYSNGMTALIIDDDGGMMVEQDGRPLMNECGAL